VLEIIEKDKGGLIVPPADTGALAEAIIKLLDNKKLAAEFGQYNESHIRKKFSLEESFQKTEGVYYNLLTK
jgi:glycosyltransferase involved in cell wall biosynthesis